MVGNETTNLEITDLLIKWSKGNQEALSSLTPIVYNELYRLAENALKNQPQKTLQPTALVNEAFIQLIGIKMEWQNRTHFFAVAANIIRGVLVDYIRASQAAKRGGNQLQVAFDEINLPGQQDMSLIALDDALKSLSKIDPMQSRLVELRFFGGLTIEETAEVLGVSTATITREWRSARAWLYREIARSS